MRKFLAIFPLLLTAVLPFTSRPALASTPTIAPAAAFSSCTAFSRNLTLGARGADVKALQQLLNARGYAIATSGAGSAGFETTLFGAKTRSALAKFQAANGIIPASGYFGLFTRAKVLILCSSGTGTTQSAPVATPVVPAPPVTTNPPFIGTGSGNGIAFTPVVTPQPATPIVMPPSASTTSPAAAIDPQSIVGVLCTYSYNGATTLIKGSGVIVSPNGYVLTARHVVDPRWTQSAYANTLTDSQKAMYANAVLDHCEIGLPENTALPSPADIRASDPQFLITQHFQYDAMPAFIPTQSNLSLTEYNTADVAILRITSAAADCSFYNHDCSNFGAFPYTPVATGAMPHEGSDEVVSYGYPAEPGLNDENSNFGDFYLKGAVGTVGYYLSGDSRFAGQPLNFAFEAQDIQTGRSGSPLFWNGRVIGILYGSTSGQESYNLSMPAIATLLSDAGQSGMLATQ